MAIANPNLEPELQAIGVLYEYVMRQLGYESGSMRFEDGETRDIDRVDPYGTRCFCTKLAGEWAGLVTQVDGE